MWLPLFVPALGLAYVAYRFGLGIARVRAARAGETERAQELQKKSFMMMAGALGLSALVGLVWAVALVVSH